MIGRMADGFQAKFSHIVISFDMNVRWFLILVAIEQEGIGTDTENHWHFRTVS
jgi:hypothetical protein